MDGHCIHIRYSSTGREHQKLFQRPLLQISAGTAAADQDVELCQLLSTGSLVVRAQTDGLSLSKALT